jgi:hypothetical protein
MCIPMGLSMQAMQLGTMATATSATLAPLTMGAQPLGMQQPGPPPQDLRHNMVPLAVPQPPGLGMDSSPGQTFDYDTGFEELTTPFAMQPPAAPVNPARAASNLGDAAAVQGATALLLSPLSPMALPLSPTTPSNKRKQPALLEPVRAR